MSVIDLAQRHRRRSQALTRAAAGRLAGLWQRVDREDILNSWRALVPTAAGIVAGAQADAADDAVGYMGAAIEEQGLDPTGPTVLAAGFAGFAYPLDDRDTPGTLEDKLLSPAYKTLSWIGQGVIAERALAGGLDNLMLRTQMQVADAARQAGGVVIASRAQPIGQVRMLVPPSCNRCVVLAGKWYRGDAGFDRHPGCDCRAIPAAENDDSLTTDPYAYFESLSEADQNRYFTKDGAQAIRDGADIFQVVNARQGMYTSSGGSLVTREGTTRRGYWGRQQEAFKRGPGRQRYDRSVRARMMPEEIYKRAAGDKARQLSLLEEYGYITPAGQVPTGAIRFG